MFPQLMILPALHINTARCTFIFTVDNLSDTSNFKFFIFVFHALGSFGIFSRNQIFRQLLCFTASVCLFSFLPIFFLLLWSSSLRNPTFSHLAVGQSVGLMSVRKCRRGREGEIDNLIEGGQDKNKVSSSCGAAEVIESDVFY